MRIRRHRGGILLTAAALLVSAFAVGTARRAPNEWLHRTGDERGTAFNPTPSSPALGPYDLELAHVIPTTYVAVQRVHACDINGLPGAEIVLTRHDSPDPRGGYHLESWTFGDSLTSNDLCEGLLMRAFRNQGELIFIVWGSENPRVRPARLHSTPSELFLSNYGHASMNDADTDFDLAVRAASLRESLDVINRLQILGSDGLERAAVEMPGVWNPRGANILPRHDGDAAIVFINSGYASAQFSYLLLDQQRLRGGTVELGAGISRPYGGYRGLTAYDLRSQELLWSRPMGTYSLGSVSGDINGDGCTETIVFTLSPANVVSAGGTTDYLCGYALCLDERGNELWRQRALGPYLSEHAAIGDVDEAEGAEVIAAFSSPKDLRVGLIMVIAADGELIASTKELAGASGTALADLNGDGREEIVAGGGSGRVCVFDGRLNIVSSCQDTAHQAFPCRLMRPFALNDIDGDGETEIAALSSGWTQALWHPTQTQGNYTADTLNYVVIMGPGLQEEARARIPWSDPSRLIQRGGGTPGKGMIIDVDGDGANEIVLAVADMGAFVFRVVPE